MHRELVELLNQPRRPRILVVGDAMLDRYVWGDVARISPEGPIPVLDVDRTEERLGGAGSVVTMLAALEADVSLAAVVGDDHEGHMVRRLLERHGAEVDCLLVAGDRPTTVKERLLGRTEGRHLQQILRVDREAALPIGPELEAQLLDRVHLRVPDADVVLVSDYAKGVCGGRLVTKLADMARRHGVRVVADPARGVDYRRYSGCTCITPNRVEAGWVLGTKIQSPQDGLEAARHLLSYRVDAAIVTLDRDGIAWAAADGRGELFPVRPRQVYDITGAGDMVLASLGWSLAMGADWPEAIVLANLAGGLEVERLGVVPLTRSELLAELTHDARDGGRKIVTLEELLPRLARHRGQGQRIVMTNGCFDLLHPGHVASLEFARNQGEVLVVGLNSDRSVRALKGEGHPIIGQRARAEMLAALACVDYVVIFDELSVAGLVEQIAPDVLVKAAEYSSQQVVGHQTVLRQGGRVVLAPMKGRWSTTGLIQRIQRMGAGGDRRQRPRHRVAAG
ncbi:MAG TPA: bifunctional heptose 7-phosphate kinase/heptose 1-phosphate adenyltransferase [Planctomycetaceae bacterium]|nr:bifunctional heptose 7-phosphate kinase/heptose 1-phosphate adenyltransferase [Planctomycetaceae bacterium]